MALDDREANKSVRTELHSREDYFTSSVGLDHQVLKRIDQGCLLFLALVWFFFFVVGSVKMQHKKRGTLFFCSVLTFCNLCGRNDRYRCSFNIYSNCLCQRFHAPFLTHPPKHLSFYCYLWDCLPYFCILNYSFFLFILSFNIHREQNDTFFVIDFAFALSAFSLSLLCSLSFTLGLCFFLSPPYLPFILGADPGVLSLLIRFSSALDFCFVLRFGWGCCYFISVLVCSLCLIWTIFQKGHKKCFHVLQ